MLQHVHAGEQLVQVTADDLLEGQEPSFAEIDQAWQHRRHLDTGELLGAGDGVGQHDGQVDRQAADVGERVRRIDGQRGEDGEDALREEGAHPALLVVGQFRPAQNLDTIGGQAGTHLLGEDARLLSDQIVGPSEDRVMELARQQTGN